MEDFFIQFKILTNFNFNSNKIKGEKIYGKNNRKSFKYFKRRVKETYNFDIADDKYIEPIYIDGADVWSSTGKFRFDKGVKETLSVQFKKDLLDKSILDAEGKKLSPIYIVSHSMGGEPTPKVAYL